MTVYSLGSMINTFESSIFWGFYKQILNENKRECSNFKNWWKNEESEEKKMVGTLI